MLYVLHIRSFFLSQLQTETKILIYFFYQKQRMILKRVFFGKDGYENEKTRNRRMEKNKL